MDVQGPMKHLEAVAYCGLVCSICSHAGEGCKGCRDIGHGCPGQGILSAIIFCTTGKTTIIEPYQCTVTGIKFNWQGYQAK